MLSNYGFPYSITTKLTKKSSILNPQIIAHLWFVFYIGPTGISSRTSSSTMSMIIRFGSWILLVSFSIEIANAIFFYKKNNTDLLSIIFVCSKSYILHNGILLYVCHRLMYETYKVLDLAPNMAALRKVNYSRLPRDSAVQCNQLCLCLLTVRREVFVTITFQGLLFRGSCVSKSLCLQRPNVKPIYFGNL